MKTDVELNSYALDFFKHGIEDALIKENLLPSGHAYHKTMDFSLVLLVSLFTSAV